MATCHVKDVKVRLIHECSRLLGVDAALCVTAWPDLNEPAISNSHLLSSESLNKIPLSAHARRAALDGSRNDGAISAELWCGVEERKTFGTRTFGLCFRLRGPSPSPNSVWRSACSANDICCEADGTWSASMEKQEGRTVIGNDCTLYEESSF